MSRTAIGARKRQIVLLAFRAAAFHRGMTGHVLDDPGASTLIVEAAGERRGVRSCLIQERAGTSTSLYVPMAIANVSNIAMAKRNGMFGYPFARGTMRKAIGCIR